MFQNWDSKKLSTFWVGVEVLDLFSICNKFITIRFGHQKIECYCCFCFDSAIYY